MDTRIVLTYNHLKAVLRHLVRNPAAVVIGPAGISKTEERTEWLVRRVEFPSRPGPSREEATVLLTAQPAVGPVSGKGTVATVYLPRDAAPTAQLLHPDGCRQPASLRIIGPGLPEFPPHEAQDRPSAPSYHSPLTTHHSPSRWSRIAGALGEAVWLRLVSLRYAIIGCGRTGSLMASSLVRMGVHELILVDPDQVEPHNLDGDGYLPEDVGQPKAEALADSLRSLNPTLIVTPCVASVTSLSALPLLKRSDILACCADNDGARWVCGLVSVSYLKPLLDVGTGVLFTAGDPTPRNPQSAIRNRAMGADIRLIIPGDACLTCFGGVANPEQVVATFRSRADEESMQRNRNWRRERRGSLRSLNQVATGLGLRLIEEFLAGNLPGSVWVRVEHGEDGAPILRECQRDRPEGRCPLCLETGGGDRPALPAK